MGSGLKRLRAWDTKTPTEDTLEITGERGQGTQVSIDSDLNLSRDGRYLLVRITYRRGAIGATERNRSAVVTLIDMRNFAALSRQTTTNSLLADSRLTFDEHDELITSGLDRRLTEVGPVLAHSHRSLIGSGARDAHATCTRSL